MSTAASYDWTRGFSTLKCCSVAGWVCQMIRGLQGRQSLWDRVDMFMSNIYEGGTSVVMYPQYFRSDVVYFIQ